MARKTLSIAEVIERTRKALAEGREVSPYKEALVQQVEYRKRGVTYSYNPNTKCVYLSITAAPVMVEGQTDDDIRAKGAQCTGYYVVSGGIVKSRDIDATLFLMRKAYLSSYGSHPTMAKYAETISL